MSKPKGRAAPAQQGAMIGIREMEDGRVAVHVLLNDGHSLLFSPDEARHVATALFRAAEIADSDMIFATFLHEIGASDEAEAVIGELRHRRAMRAEEEIGRKINTA